MDKVKKEYYKDSADYLSDDKTCSNKEYLSSASIEAKIAPLGTEWKTPNGTYIKTERGWKLKEEPK